MSQKEKGDTFELALATAISLPMVKIDREAFLRKSFLGCNEHQVEEIIENNPKFAGVSSETLDKLAKEVIDYETTKVTALSAAAGIPGGMAMVGTVPADVAQYLGHMLRVAQKLAYLYGWPDFFEDGEFDDGAKSLLTLFIGVMFGVEAANVAINKIAAGAAEQAVKNIAKSALTKTWYYPVVKKVAQLLGQKMTKEIFARSVSKVIPIVGAVTCGALTYVTFKPMSRKLQIHLSEHDLFDPELYAEDLELEDIEIEILTKDKVNDIVIENDDEEV